MHHTGSEVSSSPTLIEKPARVAAAGRTRILGRVAVLPGRILSAAEPVRVSGGAARHEEGGGEQSEISHFHFSAVIQLVTAVRYAALALRNG